MPEFPSIKPSYSLPITLPDYKVKVASFDDGGEQRLLMQHNSAGLKIALKFDMLSAGEAGQIILFHYSVKNAIAFTLPNIVWRSNHPPELVAAMDALGVGSYKWKFKEGNPPQITAVISTSTIGIYQTEINIESVID